MSRTVNQKKKAARGMLRPKITLRNFDELRIVHQEIQKRSFYKNIKCWSVSFSFDLSGHVEILNLRHIFMTDNVRPLRFSIG